MSDLPRHPEIVVSETRPGIAPAPSAASASRSALSPQTSSPAGGTSTPPGAPTIETLLRRMQAGDRAAAAEFLMRYESRIRRRVRGKLGADVRRIFDSLDIVSTLGRRLDVFIMSGRGRFASESECLGLLFKMADHALIDKARLFRTLDALEGEDGDFAHELASRLRHVERRRRSGVALEIENCMAALPDVIDRRILSLWLAGEDHPAIAQRIGLSHDAVRQRWAEITRVLRERLQSSFPEAVAT